MQEDLISFETAKLAEEKGFKTKTVTTKVTNDYLLGGKNVMITKMCIYLWMCELQKWLREKHKIHIDIQPFYYKGDFISWNLKIHNTYFKEKYKTHEEALECGIYQALKLINN